MTSLPIQSQVALKEAKDSLDMARQAGAPEIAPFEWTMAWEYLQKAKEEHGYSDYKMSNDVFFLVYRRDRLNNICVWGC